MILAPPPSGVGRRGCANALFGLCVRRGEQRRLSLWVQAPSQVGDRVVVQLPLEQGRLVDVPVEAR